MSVRALGHKRQGREITCFQAAIFDMDGVLIDSHPAHREAWRKFLASLGRYHLEGDLDVILEGRKRSDILRYFLGDVTEREIEDHGRRKDELFQEVSCSVRLVPGVLRLLKKVRTKGLTTAVATSAGGIRAHSTLDRLRLRAMFQVVVTGDDVPKGKPDPAIYQMACAQLGVKPELALAFEDSASGVVAAKSAGLRCVAVSNYQAAERLRAAGADFVVPDFGEKSLEHIQTLLV
jgi:HAD superfamily hydrolase (TIGR01509 family)